MAFNTHLQLDLPDNFPALEFAAFLSAARAIFDPDYSGLWKEFGPASNLIGWRFRASYDDMQTFIQSWQAKGENVSFEELYRRGRALFGMFTAGVSCLEATCYALNSLVSHSSLLDLPFGDKEQRACNPSNLAKLLSKHGSASTLGAKLASIIDASEWRFGSTCATV